MILIRSIFSWHLPIALLDPLWLGLAALVAAAVFVAVWVAVVLIHRRKTLPTR